MVTTVGIMTRADCCQSREDTARVLLANTEAAPDSIVGATDCLNPGGGFPASTYRNYNCTGSAPARFVYLAVFCSAVCAAVATVFCQRHLANHSPNFCCLQTPCLAINPAEITVWGAVQTFPAVMSRIVFNAATSTMSSTQGGACGGTGTAQACASNAINGELTCRYRLYVHDAVVVLFVLSLRTVGVISATDYAHSNVGANVTNYAWCVSIETALSASPNLWRVLIAGACGTRGLLQPRSTTCFSRRVTSSPLLASRSGTETQEFRLQCRTTRLPLPMRRPHRLLRSAMLT